MSYCHAQLYYPTFDVKIKRKWNLCAGGEMGISRVKKGAANGATSVRVISRQPERGMQ